ncbi:MAG: M20/M25/M40 family metallo-hydrolase [Gemmatimonadaceae bacterium]|nr:M20/M25/M40 family metallo-hydrolase [Gemmatimonadaceae bacterium]
MPSRFAPRPTSLRGSVAPVLQAACSHLEAINAQVLAWQCDVTRVPAPTGSEGARAAWMAERFAAIGWRDVRVDATGNVIARRPGAAGSRAAVWCCSHLDTVFDEPAPAVQVQGTRYSGPGIGDNGRGLAALLAIGTAMEAAALSPPHEVVLACTVGEEGLGDLRGMRALMREASPAPHAVIAIDGAGDDRIVHAALGSTRLRVTVQGPGGHSWADYGVANPVHAAAAMVSALQAILLPRDPRTTLTVARIGGGEGINSVPLAAWFDLDLRSTSAEVLADVERTLRQAVSRVERSENNRRLTDTAPLTTTVEHLGSRPSGALSEESALVRIARQATTAIGVTPRLSIGSTDASIPIAMGIPAIAIGAGGRGGGTHTPAEWYDDEGGVRGLQRAWLIVAGAAGLR